MLFVLGGIFTMRGTTGCAGVGAGLTTGVGCKAGAGGTTSAGRGGTNATGRGTAEGAVPNVC